VASPWESAAILFLPKPEFCQANGRVVDNHHPRIRGGDGIRNLWRLVGAAIVHQNEFVIHAPVL
jgi:hypothetical protein